MENYSDGPIPPNRRPQADTRRYALLSELLVRVVERLDPQVDAIAAEQVGFQFGSDLAAEVGLTGVQDPAAGLRAVSGALQTIGFDIAPEPSQGSLLTSHCPFGKTAEDHPEIGPIEPIRDARVLLKLGDSVTTDHIRPAGAIAADSPAGRYRIGRGVEKAMSNSYGSRRGNDRVMTRGTFANIRIRDQLAPGTEGGLTTDFTDGTVKPVFDAAMSFQAQGTPLVVLAGKDYGMGSSRDWAAKGTFLLGVRAVIATSYERIHRSNLVMMDVLPLTFPSSHNADTLGLDGTETFEIGVDDSLEPRQEICVRATRSDGEIVEFMATARVDTPVEVEYLRHGGILHMVLRRMAAA